MSIELDPGGTTAKITPRPPTVPNWHPKRSYGVRHNCVSQSVNEHPMQGIPIIQTRSLLQTVLAFTVCGNFTKLSRQAAGFMCYIVVWSTFHERAGQSSAISLADLPLLRGVQMSVEYSWQDPQDMIVAGKLQGGTKAATVAVPSKHFPTRYQRPVI
ncbi:hypothetical protein J6590_040389 [Homalodisca vitripennis]|nr:hypothetical protein J6590_040389 [Homalodisca vitripennis]